MAIYGISDLHLSLKENFLAGESAKIYKPMDIFSKDWHKHTERIFENWQNTVGADDIVFLPGDLSWAMTLKEVATDVDYLSQLNGTLYLSKGNHDFWWETKAKSQGIMSKNVFLLQNESVIAENVLVAATRGWRTPNSKDFKAEDEKIYKREVIRLELALKDGVAKEQKHDGDIEERWVMLHYPPVNDKYEKNELIELMEQYGVTKCFYGHLHGQSQNSALIGNKWGIEFDLVSTDYLNHVPKLLKK